MRVDWNEEICGIRLLRVRDMLRRAGSAEIGVGFVADTLRIKMKDARALVEELVRRGWLEKVKKRLKDRSKVVWYERTVAGNAFANARAVRRISRVKAKSILAGFIDRVKAVNANDDYGAYVLEVRVFGSYLDPSVGDLGDIDLGLELARRPIIGRNIVAHSKERAKLSGRTSMSFFEEIFYSDIEVRRFLKARSPYISMHRLDDIEDIQAKSKLLYRAPKKDAKPREPRPPGPGASL